MMKEDIEKILSVLGTDGILDTLISVRGMKWATASEVAEEMGIHVATAVKRLAGLYDIGILDRRVRRGRTRSAQEYSLISSSFGLDIDLDELSGDGPGDSESVGPYNAIIDDMARRLAKFTGQDAALIMKNWAKQIDDPKKILAGKPKNAGVGDYLHVISGIVELETDNYGAMTVRSLISASLDAVHASEEIKQKLGGI